MMKPAVSSARETWEAALGELQLQVSRANYKTFLQGTQGLNYKDSLFTVGVPSSFAAEWLGGRLHTQVKKTLCGILGYEVEVQFQVGQGQAAPSAPGAGEQPGAPRYSSPHPLNPKYTFQSFVVGKCNGVAHAAAQGVAENPGRIYNPLFIYGGVGLGKTHLLHAISHLALANPRPLHILYATSEQFTNEFIHAIREQKTEDFRARYRNVDMLLMDDIQFLAGKEQTQESLFHTFNDLHNANRQIVISSDRHPKSMPLLEDRLRSRFEWGLTADIQPPDLETRQAILHSKAEAQGEDVPHEVLDLIARKVRKNIRELEGALNRVIACARTSGSAITPELAAQALADAPGEGPRRNITPAQVRGVVAQYYKLEPQDLCCPRRDKALARARQVAMFLMREDLGLTLAETGRELGGRDHKTVHHGSKRITSEINADLDLRHDVLEIRDRLLAQAS